MNTSEDPSPTRRRRRRALTATLLTVALALAAAGYTLTAANATLPEPRIEAASEAARTVAPDPAAAQAAVDARELPTAIGWAEDEEVWSNDDNAYPLGSITKLITVLVCMDAKPLEPGAEGETYVWTAEDAARTDEYLAVDGVAYSIPVGTELTQRDMLKFIFLPSANDYAHAYALWTFGSNEAYLAAFEAWKQRHGLESISLVEPTGMTPDDRASAADLVRVARLALQNPTIAEFNGMQTAEMPWGIGTIENSNPLLGVMPGVIGTKTGTIFSSYNLIVSQRVDVGGREAVNIAVTLARPSKTARADSGREMLEAMAALPQQVEIVAEGEEVGTAVTADGQRVRLVTSAGASATLLPGEAAEVEARLADRLRAGDAGAEAGVLLVSSPAGEQEIPVVTDAAIVEPELWWRLTNPGTLFG
ncbi:D-alanyl-D-alanine carboxypeptidase [Leucobacter ruminantium]|uniref:D-alanyl-D-alanine carboxypeptidase n=1 Tax=Leucobacter ruminantium TaxID=1289170 RepID=A0A939LY72_9MICO|nr:D-alanyl-D-alanine carboxypeptidase [Leucobacter ruminantium]